MRCWYGRHARVLQCLRCQRRFPVRMQHQGVLAQAGVHQLKLQGARQTPVLHAEDGST